MIEVLIQSERRGERNWEFIARVVRVGRGVEAGLCGGGAGVGAGAGGGGEGGGRGEGQSARFGVGLGGLRVLAGWRSEPFGGCVGGAAGVGSVAAWYELPERFDCSLARRLVPGFDSALRAELVGLMAGLAGCRGSDGGGWEVGMLLLGPRFVVVG